MLPFETERKGKVVATWTSSSSKIAAFLNIFCLLLGGKGGEESGVYRCSKQEGSHILLTPL